MSEILLTDELTIRAPATIVYDRLTDAHHFTEWMAVEADLDARPGGNVRWRHGSSDVCQGRFVDLVPHERVVFSYDWERDEVGIPSGSTTVEIDLSETEGTVTLRLTHRGLTAPAADGHAVGWRHFLDRLAVRAQRGDASPDPWADQRVPNFL